MTGLRIAVVAALWGRQLLAPLWWQAVDRLAAAWDAAGHTVEVVVGGSEAEHQVRAEAHGAVWVETPNQPLGRKWNNTMAAAFERGADYLLVLGSDDFLAPALVEAYLPHLARGERYIGLAGIYFTDLATGRTCLFRGYAKGHRRYREPVGAGRLLHRSLLLDGRPWDELKERGLDSSMTERLQLPAAALLPVGPHAVAVDIKTAENLWRFHRVVRSAGGPVQVDPAFLASLPEWEGLRSLRPARPDRSWARRYPPITTATA